MRECKKHELIFRPNAFIFTETIINALKLTMDEEGENDGSMPGKNWVNLKVSAGDQNIFWTTGLGLLNDLEILSC